MYPGRCCHSRIRLTTSERSQMGRLCGRPSNRKLCFPSRRLHWFLVRNPTHDNGTRAQPIDRCYAVPGQHQFGAGLRLVDEDHRWRRPRTDRSYRTCSEQIRREHEGASWRTIIKWSLRLGAGNRQRIDGQTGTARLLPRLLKGRKTGPVFLTDRRARVQLPPCDIDPPSGRARLSYRQAEDLFKAVSGGATLHQLRHSALTHDAEAGASTPMLMAKSGHTSVASLARYARP